MAPNSKLPMPLQLIGVTAVLFFATSVFRLVALTRVVVGYWQALSSYSTHHTWSNFYYPVFSPLAIHAIVAVASVAVFAALLYARRRTGVRVSLLYIAAMFAVLVWHICTRLPSGIDFYGLRLLPSSDKVFLGFCVVCAVWLIGLAAAVLLPNYSLKRTFAGWRRCTIIRRRPLGRLAQALGPTWRHSVQLGGASQCCSRSAAAFFYA